MSKPDKKQQHSTLIEAQAVVERYARRRKTVVGSFYDPLSPAVYMEVQERERALIRLIRDAELAPVAHRRALEIGCGSGGNLLQLLRLGFLPANLEGNELLPERLAQARKYLPETVQIYPGDALTLGLPDAAYDVVYQSTVYFVAG